MTLTDEQQRDLYLMLNGFLLIDVPDEPVWGLLDPTAEENTFTTPENAAFYIKNGLVERLDSDTTTPAYLATRAARKLLPREAKTNPPDHWHDGIHPVLHPTLVLPLERHDAPATEESAYAIIHLTREAIETTFLTLGAPKRALGRQLVKNVHKFFAHHGDLRYDPLENLAYACAVPPDLDTYLRPATREAGYALFTGGLLLLEHLAGHTATPTPEHELRAHLTHHGLQFRIANDTETRHTPCVPYDYLGTLRQALAKAEADDADALFKLAAPTPSTLLAA